MAGYDPDADNFKIALEASTEFRQVLDRVCSQLGGREVGRRIGYAESTVSRTRAGHRLPTRTFVQSFARATLGDQPEHALARDRLLMAAGFMPLEAPLDIDAGQGRSTELYSAQLRALDAILARPEVPEHAREVATETIRAVAVVMARYLGG